MAAGDAKAIPQKNVALRVTFPLLDADGDLVSGATGLDSEVSKDGGTFADCTNEATEIATASGMYYLDLTSTEMNADTVAVIVKTSTAGAKTTPIVLYTAARSINDLAFPATSGRSMDVDASGGVEVGSFQADAITAAAIAADALAEIADAIWDETSAHTTPATMGGQVTDIISLTKLASGTITNTTMSPTTTQFDTDFDGSTDDRYIGQTFLMRAGGAAMAARTIVDFVGATGVMTVYPALPAAPGVGLTFYVLPAQTSFIDGGISAAAIAADAIGASELAADAVTEIQAGLATAAALAAVQADTDNIQTRIPAALVSGRMDASVGAMAAGVVTAAAVATDAIDADALAADAVAEMQAGLATAAALATVGGYIDTEIGDIQSRLPAALTIDGNLKADVLKIEGADPSDLINAQADQALVDYDGPTHAELVAEIDAVQADIAGLSIPSAAVIADAVWDEALAGHVGAGSAGLALGDVDAASANLDAAVSSRAVPGDAMDLVTDAVDAAALAADAVSEIAAGIDLSNLDVAVSTRAVPADIPSAASVADAVWDELLAGHAVPGSAGAALDALDTSNLDAAVSTRATPADIPSAAAVSDAVWDEAIADHAGVGSTGEALAAAGSAGDPWITPLPGAYGAGSAGKIIGDALDAAVSTRAAPADVPTAIENADALLTRPIASVEGGAHPFRSLYGMLAKLTNRTKNNTTSGKLEVYETDDTTLLATQTLSTNASAPPVVEVNTD